MSEHSSDHARFGPFELDLETAVLRRNGLPVDLPPQPSRVLVLLVAEAGNLVSRDELRRRIWGESWLEWEAGLHQAVRRIRVALDDSASEPRFVETVPRRGYRFVAAIESVNEPDQTHGAAMSVPGIALSRVSALTTKPGLDGAPRMPGTRLARAVLTVAALGLLLLALAESADPARVDELGREAEVKRSVDPEALRLHREGVYLLGERKIEQAIERFELAAQRAPDWGEPWSALSQAELARPGPDRVQRARTALEAALARDARDARAWRQLAQLRLWEEWDWTGGRRALEQALELAPESAEAWQLVASLETVLGRRDEALAAARRAVALDPVSTGLQVDLGWTHYYAGGIDDAIVECRRSLELEPDNASARQCLVQALLVLGRWREANELVASAAAAARAENASSSGFEPLSAYFENQLAAHGEGPSCGSAAAVALPRLVLGDSNGALEALVLGARERRGWEVPYARVDPLFLSLQMEPEFADVERALGLGL